jgi:hypothetical protein
MPGTDLGVLLASAAAIKAEILHFLLWHGSTLHSSCTTALKLKCLNDYQTSASVAADLLKNDGIFYESLQMVPSHVTDRDRTCRAVVALRDWFREHNMSAQKINGLIGGAHAGRTRLLFQEAFVKDVKVGVISAPNPGYDGKY